MYFSIMFSTQSNDKPWNNFYEDTRTAKNLLNFKFNIDQELNPTK